MSGSWATYQLPNLDSQNHRITTLGYTECPDGALEAGHEKVVLFALRDDGGDLVPTHAARQLADGRWTSKLGPLEDIEHTNVEDVNGPIYGVPVRFMRRAVSY